jgi:hypothetical protein
MAENTLTALIPDIYEAMDVVSRELTGMIPAVTMSASAERAALNQNIKVDIEPDYAAGVTITPAMTVPEPTGETSGSTTIQITNSKAYEFGFNGDGQMGLETGAGYMNVRANKIAQRIRRLVNDVETDLCNLHITTSRAYGTAGTTPFATAGDFTDASFAKKILLDNGAPEFDNHLVMNTTAGATLAGKQASANVAGTDSIQRQGILLPLSGLDLRQSAQIKTFTAGAMVSATTNAMGYAIGSTAITLALAGTGVVAAGDVITFAGDTNKYVVASVVFAGANPAAGDIITIAAPGLRVAIPAAATAITVIATSARNMVFNRSAIVLAARMPARPEEGDMATDVITMTDPRSGLTFEFSMYKGYRKVRYEVALAWGVKNIKPAHTGLLLG